MNNNPISTTNQKRPFWLRLMSWKVLTPFFILILILSTPLVVRQYHLSQVPYIDDPFDVKKIETVTITNAENGFIEIQQAFAKLVPFVKTTTLTSYGTPADPLELAWDERDWSHASPEVIKWVNDNQKTLALWKKGTKKPRFLISQPKENDVDKILDVLNYSRAIRMLVVLNAKRLAFEGNLEESKQWLNALFLFGYQLGQHGDLFSRLHGDSLCSTSIENTYWWAGHPNTTIAQLQQAMQENTQHGHLTIPLTTTLQYEYISEKTEYLSGEFKELSLAFDLTKDSHFAKRAMWEINYFMKGEPERSWELKKHVFVNLLSEIDKPFSEQSPQTSKYKYFKNPSTILPAEELERMIKQSKNALYIFNLDGNLSHFSRRRETKRRILQVVLALQIYKQKHGHFPATTAELLAEGDLKTMPLDATKRTKTKITYRHKKGFTVVYIVRNGHLHQNGVDACWANPNKDYGYMLEGRTPGLEY